METNYKPLSLTPPMNITVVNTLEGLPELKDFLASSGELLGFDIETNVVNDFWWRKCRTIQFGTRDKQFLIDLLPFANGNGDLLSSSQGHYGKHLTPETVAIMETIAPFLCTGKMVKCGINVSFEYMTMYWNFGMRTMGFFDCAMVERCIVAGEHSLKNYSYFSMEAMMQRYFNTQIDKELQTSFTLDGELSPAQIEYACLDTRLPLAIRAAQLRILKRDKLERIAQIENDAIGAFTDMQIHGININVEKWNARVADNKLKFSMALDALDQELLPIVGSKLDIITEEQIEESKNTWKKLNVVTDVELALKAKIRKEKDPEAKKLLELEKDALESSRKDRKELLKKETSELGKKRTKLNKLIEKCEGKALINYDSSAQLLEVFQGMKGLKEKIKDTGDDTLELFKHIPVIASLREYRSLGKKIKTYGTAWTSKWTVKPGKDEGWVHPGDGKIHAQFNQYEAETGRSSSSRPNMQNIEHDPEVRSCFEAETMLDELKGDVRVLITADMSGAELRILSELANDELWMGAFNRKEDVHSICTEDMYGKKWSDLTEPGCQYYALKEDGTPKHLKCKCKGHDKLRGETKSTNFLIVNGGGKRKLAIETGKTEDEAQESLELHRFKNGKIWEYLDESGRSAKINKESRDMFGRRRLYPTPTQDKAKEKAKDDCEKRLQYSEEEQEANIARFIEQQGRKPLVEEKYRLTHREPTSQEISRGYTALLGMTERQGKNTPLQATNVSIIKLAMGCGIDLVNGIEFLWHEFPKYDAKLVLMVHDEIVIDVPEKHAETFAKLIQEKIKWAASEVMKRVTMETEYGISKVWKKG